MVVKQKISKCVIEISLVDKVLYSGVAITYMYM